MKRINLCVVTVLLALGPGPIAHAVVTQKVIDDTFAEFSAGEFENVSLTSDGHLELAPAITNLAGVTDPIIWAAVEDSNNKVYLGSGNQGKVYQLTSKGDLSTLFAPNEVMVHALAVDRTGRLYAATSPDGRVYRLDAKGQAEVYCAPGETYVWTMTFGKDGSLYLATGDHGKILRVPPAGSAPAKAETYFETGEKNITALAWDKAGNLLAGTSPHGYLYRIDKTNHGFVMFNSSENEIKQIAVAPDGTIYVSTFTESPGQKTSITSSRSGLVILSGSGEETSSNHAAKAGAASDAQSPPSPPADIASPTASASTELAVTIRGPGGTGTPGGAEKSLGAVYRIDTNGFYERVWSAPGGEAIYSMTLLPDGSLLAGTGDKGRIYSITDANHWKLLQKTSDGAQVAALLPASTDAKQYFAATSHPAKLYRLDFALAKSGAYTSRAFDAKQKSQWGRIHPDGVDPAGTKLEFSTRSGNTEKPEKTWSDWSPAKPLNPEIAVTSPSARYLQYRVEFKRDHGSASTTPQIQRLQFYYQNENAAPVISRIKVHNEGFSISKMPALQPPAPAINLNQLLDSGGDPANPSAANPAAAALMTMLSPSPLRETKSPGFCTVVWQASDSNQDKLTYSVALRAESDTPWTTLVDKTEDTFYSFDTTGFRAGLYFIKVMASDLPANTPETARTTEAISDAFLIDNTPPVLTVKKLTLEKDHARILVDAVDGASVISSAKYSLDGKDEVALRPDGLIFDSTNETCTIELPDLSPGTHSLLLRVQDEANNASVLKLNFDAR